jgi:hypothetical protein
MTPSPASGGSSPLGEQLALSFLPPGGGGARSAAEGVNSPSAGPNSQTR